jgi:hypothetical protein
MIGELKTTRTPRNTHQNHQIGVFLNWGIPKSPWVSILKWSFMTWMISGDPHDETENSSPINPDLTSSMAMQQEPIDWKYQSHICLAYFSGLNLREYPHKI